MSLSDLEKAMELIQQLGGGDFEGPKDESLVSAAERTLGVSFPPTYRSFLSTLGCGDVEGLEVFGVIKRDFESSGIPDAIWITLKEREDAGLDPGLVLISADGSGAYVALDTGQRNATGECPVVSWEPGVGVGEHIATDFGEYLLAAVTEMAG